MKTKSTRIFIIIYTTIIGITLIGLLGTFLSNYLIEINWCSKPKLYTREEVEELCRDAHHSGVRTQHPIESYEWDEIEQWIKENL